MFISNVVQLHIEPENCCNFSITSENILIMFMFGVIVPLCATSRQCPKRVCNQAHCFCKLFCWFVSFVHCQFCLTLRLKLEGPTGPLISPRSVLSPHCVFCSDGFILGFDSPGTFCLLLRNCTTAARALRIPVRFTLDVRLPQCLTQWFVQSPPC